MLDMSKTSDAQRSKESYDRNKTKVARQRILNAIDKGKCVWKKTLYDPKYNWTNPEKAMIIKCLNNRRNRYLINPQKITFVKDKRYKNIYPSDNYKEYYYRQKEQLDILESKLNKLRNILTNIDNENVKLVLQSEINNIENQIIDNPIKTNENARNKNKSKTKQPFRSPSVSPSLPTLLSPYVSPNQQNQRQQQRANAQSTNAPQTSYPQTNAPQTSYQQTNAPQTNAPQTSYPQTNAPQTNTQSTSYQQTNAPQQEQVPIPMQKRRTPEQRQNTSPTPLYEIERANESFISMDHVINTYMYMIDKNLMYDNRTDITKEQGRHDYTRAIYNLFFRLDRHKHRTKNLLNVYKYPKRYTDITEKNKMFLHILFKLHNLSSKNKFPINTIPKSIVDLANNIEDISMFSEQFALLTNKAKEAEDDRQKKAPYYDWEEILKIPSLVKGRSMQELKDLLIMHIYINQNILRDNLGLLKLLPKKPSIRVNFNYVFENENNRYEIILNDYKNSNLRGTFKIKLNADISKLVTEYIDKMNKYMTNQNKSKIEYLITKEDGVPYKNGKLSKYIIRMFERYTRAKNLGINELRHSVATYYKDESNEFKTKIAYKMQHSLTQHLKYERYSNKIIKLPVFNNLSDEEIIRNDPYVNKKVYVYHNNRYVDGTIELDTRNRNKYKIRLEDGLKNTSYSAADIYMMLEKNDIWYNIGKEVKYTVSKDEINYGKLEYNEKHDSDDSQPPYVLSFYDTTIKPIYVTLPNKKIEII